jgi:hypothetical protein
MFETLNLEKTPNFQGSSNFAATWVLDDVSIPELGMNDVLRHVLNSPSSGSILV